MYTTTKMNTHTFAVFSKSSSIAPTIKYVCAENDKQKPNKVFISRIIMEQIVRKFHYMFIASISDHFLCTFYCVCAFHKFCSKSKHTPSETNQVSFFTRTHTYNSYNCAKWCGICCFNIQDPPNFFTLCTALFYCFLFWSLNLFNWTSNLWNEKDVPNCWTIVN